MASIPQGLQGTQRLAEVVGKYREWKQVEDSLAQARAMLQESDPDLREMAEEEVARLEPDRARIEEELKILLLPKDPNDEKNVVLEIRAGTGGDEATLFAAEIFRMYSRYAETQRWQVEVTSSSESAVGGLKEVIALVSGNKVYSKLKYESGVHRVQRVPATEQQGRIHTSAITVAVLPEADEVEIKIEPKDIRIDTFCSSGPGRPVGEHHVFRRAHHAPAHRPDRLLPGRKVADQEPRQGHARAAFAALRNGARKAAGSVGRRAPQPWSARATAARRSAPTTSRRTASPTTASASPCTSSTSSWTASSTPIVDALDRTITAQEAGQTEEHANA